LAAAEEGEMKLQKSSIVIFFVLIALTVHAGAKSGSKEMKAGAPDKAYLQKIWDGWNTLDSVNVAQYFASGPHPFFDIAPLKYKSWDEYQAGVTKELADYKSAKFTVNDDAELHPAGNYLWGTATVKYEMTHKNGRVDMGDLRWTFIFEKQGGKWPIVHEHVSMPIQ
jgi:ketosteroid isomerase-like protein